MQDRLLAERCRAKRAAAWGAGCGVWGGRAPTRKSPAKGWNQRTHWWHGTFLGSWMR